MQFATVFLIASSLGATVLGATDVMECHKPALLSNCKKVCDCPGDAWNGNTRPDCSLPICHDNCLCHGKSYYAPQFTPNSSTNLLTADPPPRYQTPPPPYSKGGKSSPKAKSVKGHRRSPEPEPMPEPEPLEDEFEF